MNNKIAIESLSMDLLRVALGYHHGSTKMADRFREEALLRVSEVETDKLNPYFRKVLKKISEILNKDDKIEIAEDALMYSTICRNYISNSG
jgi:hypothetical protein